MSAVTSDEHNQFCSCKACWETRIVTMPIDSIPSKPNHAEVLALVKRLRDGGSTQDRIDAADALERFVENNDERLSSGSISSVASGPDGTGDDAGTHTHMTLDFALKIADSHAQVDDVLEYRALAVLAAAVRAAQVHTADRCSSDETSEAHSETVQRWLDGWGDRLIPKADVAAFISRLTSEHSDDVKEDRAYYHGARDAAGMAHQSLTVMDKWIDGGCGNRVPALKANEPLAPGLKKVWNDANVGWQCECGARNLILNLPCKCGRSRPESEGEV